MLKQGRMETNNNDYTVCLFRCKVFHKIILSSLVTEDKVKLVHSRCKIDKGRNRRVHLSEIECHVLERFAEYFHSYMSRNLTLNFVTVTLDTYNHFHWQCIQFSKAYDHLGCLKFLRHDFCVMVTCFQNVCPAQDTIPPKHVLLSSLVYSPYVVIILFIHSAAPTHLTTVEQ